MRRLLISLPADLERRIRDVKHATRDTAPFARFLVRLIDERTDQLGDETFGSLYGDEEKTVS
jgi:hypothetical protein